MRVPSDAPVQSFVARQALLDKLAARSADNPSTAGDNGTQPQPVSISGRALLKQRLADVLATGVATPARPGAAQAGRHALTAADQQLLSDVYVWAAEQGADLSHVDRLGRDLASYRAGQPTAGNGQPGRSSPPALPPATGSAQSENPVMKRILDSGALAGTRLDPGFIRHMSETARGSGSSVPLAFMEKVVNRFSTDGGKAQRLGDAFAAGGKSSVTSGTAQADVDKSAGKSRKPITLESLRFERIGAAMKALGARSLSNLWDALLGRGRFRS